MLLFSLDLKSLVGLAQKPRPDPRSPSPLHQAHSPHKSRVPMNWRLTPHPRTLIKATQAASILLANSARMRPALEVLNQIALRLATGWGLGGPDLDLNTGAHLSPPLVSMKRPNRIFHFLSHHPRASRHRRNQQPSMVGAKCHVASSARWVSQSSIRFPRHRGKGAVISPSPTRRTQPSLRLLMLRYPNSLRPSVPPSFRRSPFLRRRRRV